MISASARASIRLLLPARTQTRDTGVQTCALPEVCEVQRATLDSSSTLTPVFAPPHWAPSLTPSGRRQSGDSQAPCRGGERCARPDPAHHRAGAVRRRRRRGAWRAAWRRVALVSRGRRRPLGLPPPRPRLLPPGVLPQDPPTPHRRGAAQGHSQAGERPHARRASAAAAGRAHGGRQPRSQARRVPHVASQALCPW